MSRVRTNLVLLLALQATVGAFAQQTVKVDLGNARFVRNLVETWISEYERQTPGSSVEIVDTPESADVVFSIAEEQRTDATVVGRFLVLPISNSESDILNDRKVRKGLNAKVMKDIFIVKDFVDEFADEDEYKFNATVYCVAGKKSAVSSLFAHHLGTEPSKLKGKKVIGQEQSAVRKVIGDSTAVSFNVPSVVFDAETRKPLNGLAVLPVDIDGNGRVSEEEKHALGNLDDFTSYVELAGRTGLPSGEVAVSTSGAAGDEFASWVASDGQKYLKKFGFIGRTVNLAHK